MPTYQYACPDCGAEFEKVQKFSDNPIKKCPTCGKSKVHRVINRVAVAFKGTGFYINDSKSSSSSTASSKKDETPKTSEAAGADAGTTETSAPTDKADTADKAEKTEKVSAAGSDDKPAKTTSKKKAE